MAAVSNPTSAWRRTPSAIWVSAKVKGFFNASDTGSFGFGLGFARSRLGF
jgi:hypothetical protein